MIDKKAASKLKGYRIVVKQGTRMRIVTLMINEKKITDEVNNYTDGDIDDYKVKETVSSKDDGQLNGCDKKGVKRGKVCYSL